MYIWAESCVRIHMHVYSNLLQHRRLLDSRRWDRRAWILRLLRLSLQCELVTISLLASRSPTCPLLVHAELIYKHLHSSQLKQKFRKYLHANVHIIMYV